MEYGSDLSVCVCVNGGSEIDVVNDESVEREKAKRMVVVSLCFCCCYTKKKTF